MSDDYKSALLFLVFLAALVLFFSGRAYRWVDSHGMFPHQEEVSVTASANWLVGETKDCTAYPLNGSSAKIGSAISFLKCDDGPKHQVRVEFWGRKEQPEYDEVYWKCRREESDFTCSETSGLRGITVEELGKRYQAKYPSYASDDPIETGRALKRKYPEYSWVRDMPTNPQSTPTPPAMGAIVSGYRFKGGDPGEKSSWQKVEGDTTDEVKPWYKGKLDKIFPLPQ